MSFDLYFVVPPGPGQTWDVAMDRLEVAAMENKAPTADDLAQWDRLTKALRPLLSNMYVSELENRRELDSDDLIQVGLSPGEVSITTPYWFDGVQAEKQVAKLRRVAALVEKETGLVAYDPQVGAAFLDTEPSASAQAFDQAREVLRDIGARRESKPERPWWAFWRK